MSVSSIDILGYIAGAIIVVSYIPQIITLYKQKNSKDVSVYTYYSFLLAQTLFIFYAIIKNDLPILMVNVFSSLLCIVNIMMIYMYKPV